MSIASGSRLRNGGMNDISARIRAIISIAKSRFKACRFVSSKSKNCIPSLSCVISKFSNSGFCCTTLTPLSMPTPSPVSSAIVAIPADIPR